MLVRTERWNQGDVFFHLPSCLLWEGPQEVSPDGQWSCAITSYLGVEDSPLGHLTKLDRRQHISTAHSMSHWSQPPKMSSHHYRVDAYISHSLTLVPRPARWWSCYFLLNRAEDVENLPWLLAGEGSKRCSAARGTVKKVKIKGNGLHLRANSPVPHYSPCQGFCHPVLQGTRMRNVGGGWLLKPRADRQTILGQLQCHCEPCN